MLRTIRCGATVAFALLLAAASSSALAVSFTTSYTDGGNWNAVYAQGFKASMMPNPDPGLTVTDTVALDRFEFFKSGNPDITDNFRLAIINNFFVDLDTFSTTSPELLGLSTNTVSGTAQFATGDPITFDFDGLELDFGDGEDSSDDNYAAVFVTEGEGGALAPLLVPVLIADYVETAAGSGVYVPESDYGDATVNYFLSASNFISGTPGSGHFLATFNDYYADANFVATFNLADTGLEGDFNGDLTVDAADYTVWRDGLGAIYTLDDYDTWKTHFGMTAGGGAAAATTVPEPTALTILGLGTALLLVESSRRRVR